MTRHAGMPSPSERRMIAASSSPNAIGAADVEALIVLAPGRLAACEADRSGTASAKPIRKVTSQSAHRQTDTALDGAERNVEARRDLQVRQRVIGHMTQAGSEAHPRLVWPTRRRGDRHRARGRRGRALGRGTTLHLAQANAPRFSLAPAGPTGRDPQTSTHSERSGAKRQVDGTGRNENNTHE